MLGTFASTRAGTRSDNIHIHRHALDLALVIVHRATIQERENITAKSIVPVQDIGQGELQASLHSRRSRFSDHRASHRIRNDGVRRHLITRHCQLLSLQLLREVGDPSTPARLHYPDHYRRVTSVPLRLELYKQLSPRIEAVRPIDKVLEGPCTSFEGAPQDRMDLIRENLLLRRQLVELDKLLQKLDREQIQSKIYQLQEAFQTFLPIQSSFLRAFELLRSRQVLKIEETGNRDISSGARPRSAILELRSTKAATHPRSSASLIETGIMRASCRRSPSSITASWGLCM